MSAYPLSGRTSKSPAQRDRILGLLRERGRAGVSNADLNSICFRYGARIFGLRHMGAVIETRYEGEGIFWFILHSEPNQPETVSSLRSEPGEVKPRSSFQEKGDWYESATGKARPSDLHDLPLFRSVREERQR